MTKQYEYNRVWRHRHPETRAAGRVSYYRRNSHDDRNARAWYTAREDAVIMRHELPDREIAAQLGRTVKAIQMHRLRLRARGWTG
jgi:hypothetical protein